jgi:hypothetical protein
MLSRVTVGERRPRRHPHKWDAVVSMLTTRIYDLVLTCLVAGFLAEPWCL